MSKIDIEIKEVCFTPADGSAPETLVQKTKYGVDTSGNPAEVIKYTQASGVIVDISTYKTGGTIVSGACAIATPQVEFEPRMEKLADGSVKQFTRRITTSFDALGNPSTAVSNFELDGVTPYVVIDEDNVRRFDEEAVIQNSGVVTSDADWQ